VLQQLQRHEPSSSKRAASRARPARSSSRPPARPARTMANRIWLMHARGIEAAWRRPHRAAGGRRGLCSIAAAEARNLLHGLAAHGLPCFSVPPGAVRVLASPDEFNQALLRGARSARRRVSIASLYLGDGPLETALVDELCRGQATGGTPRELHLFLDYHRARRQGALTLAARVAAAPHSAVHLLSSPAAPAPVPTEDGARANVAASRAHEGLATAPTAPAPPSPFGRSLLPSTLCEVLGVQHLKLMIFDETVLLTGANLSDEYLTRRQDRYIELSHVPHLALFLAELLQRLALFSHSLTLTPLAPDGAEHPTVEGAVSGARVDAPDGAVEGVPPRLRLCAPRAPASGLAAAVEALLREAREVHPVPTDAAIARGGCWLAPVPQMGAAGMDVELRVMEWLLRYAGGGQRSSQPAHSTGDGTADGDDIEPTSDAPRTRCPLLLSSPYLNLPRVYQAALVHQEDLVHQGATTTLLSSAPSASGFHNASGVKALIPRAYSALEARLRSLATASGTPLRILHYSVPGWTFHAKGLWMWPPLPLLAVDPLQAVPLGVPTPTFAVPTPASDDSVGRPLLTVVGSSNFSERSVRRDVELSFCLVATDARVRDQLCREQRLLRMRSHEPVGGMQDQSGSVRDRGADLLARMIAALMRTFF